MLRDPLATPVSSLQVFEEDTRMSGDFNFTTPMRMISVGGLNEESQSSFLSSASVTQENSATLGTILSSTTTSARKPKAKMEVGDVNGQVEFTAGMLAEYEWPQPTGGNSRTASDTYMIQEQIAEYLGVKSFKRKYPDLMRRPVDMEERNYIMEQGLASEKMCDLGLTAVYASEVLDIMCNDYPDKYEEYKRFQREKHYLDRQKYLRTAAAAAAAEGVDRSQLQKDRAIESASSWNAMMNKERRDTRRSCIDLQTYVVQVPRVQQLQSKPTSEASHYPVALVPGQFSEYYHTYTPEELACYPINTALLDPLQLREILRSDRYRKLLAEVASASDSDGGSSSSSSDSDLSDDDDDDSSSDSDDSSSSGESEEDTDVKATSQRKPASNNNTRLRAPPPPKTPAKTTVTSATKPDPDKLAFASSNPHLCAVCSGPQNKNKFSKPERFIRCSVCRRRAHPSCIDMSAKMFRRAQEYAWQCADCKSCEKCHRRPEASRRMVFCDQCDRGHHLACIGLRNVPDGRWHCSVCCICNRCGARNPEGHPNPYLSAQQREHLAMMANWTHEYTTNELTRLREHALTLCVPCVRLRKQQDEDRQKRLQQRQREEEAKVPADGSSSSSSGSNNNNNNNGGNGKAIEPTDVGTTTLLTTATTTMLTAETPAIRPPPAKPVAKG